MPADIRSPIENLLQWAETNGAKFPNFDLKDRAIHSLNPIKSGELICFIPDKLLLSVSICRQTALGKKLIEIFKNHDLTRQDKYPHSLDLIVMTMFLVSNRYNCDEFFYPYITSLPQSYDLPICWPIDVIDTLLKGTNLHFMTIQKLNWIEDLMKVMNENDISIEKADFIWGLAAISSRAFPKSTFTLNPDLLNDWISISEICLYPLLDMFNHNPNCKLTWKMDNDGVRFVAGMDMPVGEVFNNYGPKGNENLLGNYGFVIENNEYDYVKLCLNTTESPKLLAKRTEILKNNSLSQFIMLFESDTELSEKFWGVSRIMTSSPVELGLYKKGIITKKLDITCLDTMYKLIEAKLNAIGDAMDEVDSMNTSWKASAKEYRNGQKRIYNHYLTLLKNSCSGLLSQTKFLTFEYEEGDEIGGTIMGLLEKLHSGCSDMVSLFEKYDGNKCKKTLGKEYAEFKEFYEEFGGDKREVLWGFTMVKIFGGEHPSCLGSESGFGIYLEVTDI